MAFIVLVMVVVLAVKLDEIDKRLKALEDKKE
jgi:hypothetical protein